MKYKLKKAAPNGGVTAKAGVIVYSLRMTDYGIAAEDTRMTGVNHKSVTFSHEGEYPFFTVPVDDLELVE